MTTEAKVAEKAVETVVENAAPAVANAVENAATKAITHIPSPGKDTAIIGVVALGTVAAGIGIKKLTGWAIGKAKNADILGKMPFGKKSEEVEESIELDTDEHEEETEDEE